VSFYCDLCGDTIKKTKIPNHLVRCHTQLLRCIDCLASFNNKSYNTHTSCISEAEKYQKTLYKPKNNQEKLNQSQPKSPQNPATVSPNNSSKIQNTSLTKENQKKDKEEQTSKKQQSQEQSSEPVSNDEKKTKKQHKQNQKNQSEDDSSEDDSSEEDSKKEKKRKTEKKDRKSPTEEKKMKKDKKRKKADKDVKKVQKSDSLETSSSEKSPKKKRKLSETPTESENSTGASNGTVLGAKTTNMPQYLPLHAEVLCVNFPKDLYKTRAKEILSAQKEKSLPIKQLRSKVIKEDLSLLKSQLEAEFESMIQHLRKGAGNSVFQVNKDEIRLL